MGRKKKKKLKIKKNYIAIFFAAIFLLGGAAVVVYLAPGNNFIFLPKNEIYVSSASPEQGDTILVKVNGIYPWAMGQFNNLPVALFKENKYADWHAYLGIDADLEPGKYIISVEVQDKKLEKEIIVQKKDFPSEKLNIGVRAISNIRNNDNPVLAEVFSKSSAEPYFEGEFIQPLEKIEKSGLDFGEFINAGGAQIQHMGIDLRAAPGTEIFAINNGKVVLEKSLSNYGNTLVVDHGMGIFSLYLHIDQFLVRQGDYVKKGEVIALSGNTGFSSGPHLHFSVKNSGSRVNPVQFVGATKKPEISGLAGLINAILRLLPF